MTRSITNLGGTASDVVVGKVGVSPHFCQRPSLSRSHFCNPLIAWPHADDVRYDAASILQNSSQRFPDGSQSPLQKINASQPLKQASMRCPLVPRWYSTEVSGRLLMAFRDVLYPPPCRAVVSVTLTSVFVFQQANFMDIISLPRTSN